jgi:hypothetical protein
MFYLSFTKEELFTLSKIEEFYNGNPLIKSELISNVLINYFVISDEVIYIYNSKNITYNILKQSSPLDYFITIIRKFIINSYDNLPLRKKQYFDINYDVKEFYKLDYYREFIIDVYNLLINDDIKFDVKQKNIVHYKNGFFDVKKNKFFDRNVHCDFISKYINEDYFEKDDNEIVYTNNPMKEDDEDKDDKDDEDEDDQDDQDEDDKYIVKLERKKQFTREEIKKVIDLI